MSERQAALARNERKFWNNNTDERMSTGGENFHMAL